MYSINFAEKTKSSVYVCITMGQIVTYLWMVQTFTNLKQNISKL